MAGISELTVHTGYWLRLVSNAVSHAFAAKVSAEGVTVAEWVVLRSLYGNGDMAPTALAEAMGMTKGAISKLSDRLLAKELIGRSHNPDDGRAHRLSLTEKGRMKVPKLAVLADQNDAEYFGVLKNEEHATLKQILKKLAERRGILGAPVD